MAVSRARRMWAGVLVVLLLLTLIPGMGAAAVQDVVGTRFEQAVLYLQQLGIVEGRPEGFFPLEPITRAEATKIIVSMIGQADLANLLRGAVTFKDVPGSHWASGFIAIAKNSGIVNGFPDGTFKPNELVTYAQYAKMLIEAAGLAPSAGLTWPANYVDAALRAGMLTGVGFQADTPAIRGDCGIMSAFTVKEVVNPATGKTLGQTYFGETRAASLELTPVAPKAAVGAAVQFMVVARDAAGTVVETPAVTFTTSDPSKSMITSAGRFSATHAGTYTVTAKAGALTTTATVTIFGVPIALKATASSSTILANGQATTTINVEIIDAAGARVLNADNAITLQYEETNGAVTLPATVTVNATNGLATFVVTATTTSGVTDKLKATSTGLASSTTTVTTVAPSAASLSLTIEPTQLPANESYPATATVKVLDQTGQPMTSGVFMITFSITGQGLLQGSTDPLVVATVNQTAQVTVSSKMGEAGSFTLTASSSGLGARSVNVPTYIAGVPTQLRVTSVDTSGEVGVAGSMRITVGLFDVYSRPAPATAPITVEFVPPASSGLTGLDSFTFAVGQSYRSIDFQGTKSGTYTVTVRDQNTATPAVSSTSFSCTLSATAVGAVDITPTGNPIVYLSYQTPTLTLSAQLKDLLDNNVAKSGVKVQFSAAVTGTGTVSWSAAEGKVTTDSTGKATIVMYGQSYVGNQYVVTVAVDTDNDGLYDDVFDSTAPGGIVVANAVPQSISVAFKSTTGATIGSIAADANKEARCHIAVVDTYGNPVGIAGLDIEVTLSNLGRHVLSGSVYTIEGTVNPVTTTAGVYRFFTDADGEVVFGFNGGLEGTFTASVKCLNAVPSPSGSASFRTNVGSAAARGRILKTDRTLAEDVNYAANALFQVLVALTDNGGNPVPAPGAMTVNFHADRASAQYRPTSSGAATTSVNLPRGSAYVTIWYFDSVAGNLIDLFDDVESYTAYSLDVEWNAATGKVEGTVLGADSTPVPGVTVRLYRTAGTGTFTGPVTEVTGTTNSQGVFSATFAPSGSDTVAGELVDGRNMAGYSQIPVTDSDSF